MTGGVPTALTRPNCGREGFDSLRSSLAPLIPRLTEGPSRCAGMTGFYALPGPWRIATPFPHQPPTTSVVRSTYDKEYLHDNDLESL